MTVETEEAENMEEVLIESPYPDIRIKIKYLTKKKKLMTTISTTSTTISTTTKHPVIQILIYKSGGSGNRISKNICIILTWCRPLVV